MAAFAQPVPRRTTSGWMIVLEQELRDLWLGGRGLVLTFAFSLLMSVIAYLVATNKALNLLEQNEAVNLSLQVAVATGAFLSLLAAADAVSGDAFVAPLAHGIGLAAGEHLDRSVSRQRDSQRCLAATDVASGCTGSGIPGMPAAIAGRSASLARSSTIRAARKAGCSTRCASRSSVLTTPIAQLGARSGSLWIGS